MARDHGRVNLAVFGDDDFLDLTGDENHLFLILWLSPSLTYCGSDDWHPGRIAKRCGSDWDAARVEHSAAGLSRTGFLLIDLDTDELLVRSWIKHDALWKSPVMAVSMANARAAMASRVLRGVVVNEVQKLHKANPEMKSWTRPAVVSLLKQRSIDPSTIAPFNPSVNPCPNPSSNPSGTHTAPLTPNPPSTPAPAPATATQKKQIGTPAEAEVQKPSPRGTRLKEGWKPEVTGATEKLHANLDASWIADQLERFHDHWSAESSAKATKLNWDAAWRTWLKNAIKWDAPRQGNVNAGTNGRPMSAARAARHPDVKIEMMIQRLKAKRANAAAGMEGEQEVADELAAELVALGVTAA